MKILNLCRGWAADGWIHRNHLANLSPHHKIHQSWIFSSELERASQQITAATDGSTPSRFIFIWIVWIGVLRHLNFELVLLLMAKRRNSPSTNSRVVSLIPVLWRIWYVFIIQNIRLEGKLSVWSIVHCLECEFSSHDLTSAQAVQMLSFVQYFSTHLVLTSVLCFWMNKMSDLPKK